MQRVTRPAHVADPCPTGFGEHASGNTSVPIEIRYAAVTDASASTSGFHMTQARPAASDFKLGGSFMAHRRSRGHAPSPGKLRRSVAGLLQTRLSRYAPEYARP